MPPEPAPSPKGPPANSIFAELTNKIPRFATRRTLLILNMQNDTFSKVGSLQMVDSEDFRARIVAMIPYYRALGEIIWVNTELPDGEAAGSEGPLSPKKKRVKSGKKGKKKASPQAMAEPAAAPAPSGQQILHDSMMQYFPTSQAKAAMRKTSPGEQAKLRKGEFETAFSDFDMEGPVPSPSEGSYSGLYRPGTPGAALTADMAACFDQQRDIIVVKNHHSAFDATSLLMSLRMKLVTHIYLAGMRTDISVLATAEDAVRHGFQVSVVEDCLGYRTRDKHIEAMRKMADELGVEGVDSEEIMEEAGGRAPPDAAEPLFTGPGLGGIQQEEATEEPQPRPSSSSDSSGKLKACPGSKGNPSSALNAPEPSLDQADVSSDNENDSADEGANAIDVIRESIKKGALQPTGGAKPQARVPRVTRRRPKQPDIAVLGLDDSVGTGDSRIIVNALSATLSETAFELLRKEVAWQAMLHRTGEVPRRVAVQGETHDGSVPIYRHPADESPPLLAWTSTVLKIRDELQMLLKQPFNHALIQLYRSGQDFISEHSDKTLDVVRGSSIINMSLGAQRTMTLRTKKSEQIQADGKTPTQRLTQKIPMPHNSVFVLGARTNARWLHGVRADKRPPAEKRPEEKAFGGERISLTFRHIGTFTDVHRTRIWGQGAVSKIRAAAGTISTSDSDEMESMVIAFGKENQEADFDWDAKYGRGFDTLNLVVQNVPAEATLVMCGDELSKMRVKMAVIERDIPCRITSTQPSAVDDPMESRNVFSLTGDESPLFRGVGESGTEVRGDLPILFHIFKSYPRGSGSPGSNTAAADAYPAGDEETDDRELHRTTSNVLARVTQANELLYLWQELCSEPLSASTRATHQMRRLSRTIAGMGDAPDSTVAGRPAPMDRPAATAFVAELEIWEEYTEESTYAGGDAFSVVDAAFWPLLNEIVEEWDGWSAAQYGNLANYWRRVGGMECTKKAIEEGKES